jgi:hypothetical protein
MRSLIWILTGLFLCVACSKMDDYKKFTDGKEITYSGKNDSLKILPGNNRLKLSWWVTSDPSITKTVIYMNNRRDSIVVAVKRESGKQLFEHLIDPLQEGSYSFEVVNYNEFGNRSVSSFVSGRTYGGKYISTLLNRALLNSEIINDNAIRLSWGTADVQSYGTTIHYTQENGKETVLELASDQKIIELPNFKKGGKFAYQTRFMPDSLCIDTFRTVVTEIKPLFEKQMDKKLFNALVLPGDAPMVPGDSYQMSNAWDGEWSTNYDEPYGNWRSLSSNKRSATDPATATIDLGELAQLSRCRINHYWRYENRMMKRYEIYGRADLPADGSWDGWTKIATFKRTDQTPSAWIAGDNFSFEETSPAVRYIRIKCFENYQSETDMGFAEITFWKTL